MLYLKPVKGAWYISSSEFPGGCWAAFSDQEVATQFMEWMFEQQFDCVGILSRLHFSRLTVQDVSVVKAIQANARHPAQVKSKLVPISRQIAKTRAHKVNA